MEPLQPSAARTASAHWSVSLTSGLIPGDSRVRLDRAIAAAMDADRHWAATFVSGVLTDLAGCLPAGDMWQTLDARLGRRVTGRPVRGGEGAWSGPRPFAMDLGAFLDTVPLGQPGLDTAFAGIAHDGALSRRAAAAIGLAGREDWTVVADAIWTSTGWTADDAMSAIRWSLQRVEHTGRPVDGYPLQALLVWGWAADQAAAGRDLTAFTAGRILAVANERSRRRA
jgi:hypothetical protein